MLVCNFFITERINPFGSGWAEGKIEAQVRNQVFLDAEKCRKHFISALKENFAKSKALLEQALIDSFIKNYGGDK